MRKQRAYILIGLPGSGKSTWSERQLNDGINPRGCVIISRDVIRYMLNGDYKYVEEQQDLITDITASVGRAVLKAGNDIIVDQANINKQDRKDVVNYIVKEVGGRDEIEIFFIQLLEENTDVLVKRRLAGDARGENAFYYKEVIKKLKKKFEPIDCEKEDYDFIITIDATGRVIDKILKSQKETKKDEIDGIPIEELWSLHHTLALYIYPRLKAFRKFSGGTPGYFSYKNGTDRYSLKNGPGRKRYDISNEIWMDILDKMILAFELWLSSDDWNLEYNSKEYNRRWAKIDEGLSLFRKHFNGLWY